MNVVDSSGWLEYFAGGPNAGDFAPPIEETDALAVPTIIIHEVFRWMRTRTDLEGAFRAVTAMRRGRLIDLDADLAIAAADLAIEHSLPLADSIILASAQSVEATLWTQDADFEGLSGVEYRPHRES